MIHSMTGFARVQDEGKLGWISIELKAVNSRYLELFCKMPETIRPLENSLRKILSTNLARGKIDCNLRYYADNGEQLAVNEEYLQALLKTSKRLSEQYQVANAGVGELLRLPGVMVEQTVDSNAMKNWIIPLFEQAVEELLQQRRSEGQHLKGLLADKLTAVSAIVEQAQQNYQQSTHKVKNKLYTKLEEVTTRQQSQVDEARFEQEMIYLLQKMDIAEEIDRLRGHIVEVEKLLSADIPVGRKLDFLMQEMNRESNTIASKSQHLGLTMNSVELKVLLEQMREQIQNIE